MAPSAAWTRPCTDCSTRPGKTYADEAGITLKDTPAPLYRLLVLSVLLSTRIRAGIAVDAARELVRSGFGTPQRMHDATWQQRVGLPGDASALAKLVTEKDLARFAAALV